MWCTSCINVLCIYWVYSQSVTWVELFTCLCASPPSEQTARNKQESFRQITAKYFSTPRRLQQCGKCGSSSHKLWDCPKGGAQKHQEGTQPGQLQVQQLQPGRTSQKGESLKHCERLGDELAKAEFQRMSGAYQYITMRKRQEGAILMCEWL